MPPVELIRPEALTNSAQYAYAAVAPPGARVIALAGACPLDAAGVIVLGSLETQTRAAFKNMVTALEGAGADMTDILSTRLLVASARQEDLHAAWSTFRAAMGSHDAPSTLLGVTVLGYPGQLVEIEALAAILPS
ncbi:enamine deaminase RidA [Subtercola boreus]|uniref:Enamine deaminase RidA n=1 Tax=Subtercola boreus TaxID=120213 RepID=A0A3E0VDN2_9MICO|nr:RidA family protein [Subtercola boreus]RFA07653.1 enamine deaminase RidA [Subtercola boreus]